MKECKYCPYQGGNSLCELCEAGSMMPDRQEEICEERDQNPD